MGKKAKLKQIRRLAEQLPVVNIGHVVGELVSGGELIKTGVNKLPSGERVMADQRYRRKETVEVSLNHNRKMKKLYNRYGAAGVQGYMTGIKRHVASQVQKVEEVVIPKGRKLQNEVQ